MIVPCEHDEATRCFCNCVLFDADWRVTHIWIGKLGRHVPVQWRTDDDHKVLAELKSCTRLS